jgi:RNA polymerase sigma-54 factor
MMRQRQFLTQKQLLKLSPQQIQLLNLLQLNCIGIEQRIKDELEENPALEEGETETEEEQIESNDESEDDFKEDDSPVEVEFNYEDFLDEEYIPEYKTRVNNTSPSQETYVSPLSQSNTFQDQLKDQLQFCSLSNREKKIAFYLVDNLDDNGCLSIPISKLENDLSFAENMLISEEEIQKVLNIIKQRCEPVGVGAQSLQECLLIQLQRKPHNGEASYKNAVFLLENFFNELSNRNYEKILRRSSLTHDDVNEALKIITHLNPKPISVRDTETTNFNTIIPEFIVVREDDRFDVALTNQNVPDLRLNRKFTEIIEDLSREKNEKQPKKNRSVVQFVKQKINSAKWFIEAIKQRERTMLKTMTAIVELQRDFFLTGDEKKLKPMILKDVAEKIGMDISTVSRTASNKYVQTQFGINLLKFFFCSGTMKNGEEVSNKKIQKLISEMVSAENKQQPLTDFLIVELLKQNGYAVARRTVAKYRQKLNIPIARLRVQLN